MSCEFTPQQPQQVQRGAAVAHYEAMAAEAEAMKKAELEAELDAEVRYLLACVLALVGGVAAVAFTLGYVSASMGLL